VIWLADSCKRIASYIKLFLVRFLDVTTMLALIRVPRDLCHIIRSTLTLLSELQGRRIALSVLSVKGSARTAKVDCIRKTRYFYHERLANRMKLSTSKVFSDQNELERTCRSMEEAIETISNIDY
jgi:Rpp14/Pop5 family